MYLHAPSEGYSRLSNLWREGWTRDSAFGLYTSELAQLRHAGCLEGEFRMLPHASFAHIKGTTVAQLFCDVTEILRF